MLTAEILVPHPSRFSKTENSDPQALAILGSTGSIGCSTLKVVRQSRRYRIETLAAGRNVQLMAEQIREFRPRRAIVAGPEEAHALKTLLPADLQQTIEHGPRALEAAVRDSSVDCVVAAVVGVAGLAPVLAALETGKRVCLANKESLVAGGSLVRAALKKGKSGAVIPIDSEHAALLQLFQALARDGSYALEELSSLILTASGGPFLNTPLSELDQVTPAQAVKHPRWNMGAKISVDSATMVNKALELIEAFWLFGLPAEAIEVVVHPQSTVHAMLRLKDGCLLAQLSHTDMVAPISYALGFPRREQQAVVPAVDFAVLNQLTFQPLDNQRFKAVELARAAVKSGSGAMAVFNIANEIAVQRFLKGTLKFSAIVPFIEEALNSADSSLEITSLEMLQSLQTQVDAATCT